MPSRAIARVGVVTTASLSLALMVGAPAFAFDSTDIGKPCPTDSQDLLKLATDNFVCDVNNTIQVPPPSAPSDSGVVPPPAPVIAPPPVVTPPAGAPPVIVVPDPTTPGTTAPTNTPGGSTQSAGDGKTTTTSGTMTRPATPVTVKSAPGTTLKSSAKAIDPAGASNTLLAAAKAASLPSFAAALPPLPLGHAGLPLSAYTPVPNLADVPLASLPPASQIAAVQAPLLAAGEDAAGGGGFALASLGGRALPGLLVVLATALVASIGAANIRVWQGRLTAVHG